MMLITGANGAVGRQVMNLLRSEGIAVTRRPGFGVSGDLFRPQWLAPALTGVDAIQISPRATGPGLPDLLKLAVKQGVRRVVLLWTVRRLADFAANALAWAPQIRAGDVVRGARQRPHLQPLIRSPDSEALVCAEHESETFGACFVERFVAEIRGFFFRRFGAALPIHDLGEVAPPDQIGVAVGDHAEKVVDVLHLNAGVGPVEALLKVGDVAVAGEEHVDVAGIGRRQEGWGRGANG